MAMQDFKYKSLTEIYKRSKSLYNQFDFKNAESLERMISATRMREIKQQLEKMLEYSPELEFILNGQSKQYAKEIFKILQGTYLKIKTKESATNLEIKEFIQYSVEKIEKLCVIIQSNNEFKYLSQNEEHRFNKQEWLSLVDIEAEIKPNIFFTDLDGGLVANEISKKATRKNIEMSVYGVDTDIKKGEKSRELGLNVARGGILEASKNWVDLAYVAITEFSFKLDSNTLPKTQLAKLIRSKFMKNKGVVIFNYPYYKAYELKHLIEKNKVMDWTYTDDHLGNLLIAISIGTEDKDVERTIQNLAYRWDRKEKEKIVISVETEPSQENVRFRGKYTDLNDILTNEFKGKESSLDFISAYYKPKSKTDKITTPLVEIKDGHIPAIATSESVNGRYVDEIYRYLNENEKGFDHIHSTKIVKREIEEAVVENKNGVESKLISVKKSNVIHSVVLTAKGDYVELFGEQRQGGES